MSEKIFAGSGRIISTQYGDMPKITLHKDNINSIVKYMKENNSDFCTLVMKKKREVEAGKPTHYLEIDQWKPEQPKQPIPQKEYYTPAGGEKDKDIVDESVPF